jgi:hypothetical protein
MDHQVLTLHRLDRLIWGIVATVAIIVFAAPLLNDFRIAWRTFATPTLACALLLAAGCFYRRWRPDARLASGLLSTAQLVAFGAVAAPLSYIAASANLPLYDHGLDAIDRAIGFDWKALLAIMDASPLTHAVLTRVGPYFTACATALFAARRRSARRGSLPSRAYMRRLPSL